MAALTGSEQVFLDDLALRIIGCPDIMHTVTIDTNRFVRFLIGSDLFKEDDCGAVEIGDIRIKHVGTDAVPIHEGRIGVAFGTDLGGEEMKWTCGRALDIVHPVTIDTGRHIGIPVSQQGAAVHALFVEIVDLRVASLAGFGDPDLAQWGERVLDIVRTVAVGADRGLQISRRESGGMNRVQGGVIITGMTLSTGGIEIDGELPPSMVISFGMGKPGNVGVTLHTGIARMAMNRIIEPLPVDG